jgi:hypothetical protein
VKRYFSYEEATARIPTVRAILYEMRELRDQLSLARAHLDALWSSDAVVEDAATLREIASAQSEMDRLARELADAVQRLDETGAEIRDIEMGLVDFLTLREGQPVYFCWRLGEDSIGYWHRLTEGYAGRKPIDRRGWTGPTVS